MDEVLSLYCYPKRYIDFVEVVIETGDGSSFHLQFDLCVYGFVGLRQIE